MLRLWRDCGGQKAGGQDPARRDARGKDMEVGITLGHKMQRSFKIIPMANPNALQTAILRIG